MRGILVWKTPKGHFVYINYKRATEFDIMNAVYTVPPEKAYNLEKEIREDLGEKPPWVRYSTEVNMGR